MPLPLPFMKPSRSALRPPGLSAWLVSFCLVLGGWASVAKAQTPEEINAMVFQRLSALAQSTGNPEARYHLGMLLHRGIGTTKNPAQALAEFTAAAEAGHALAAYQAGGYHSGLYPGVVPVDLKRAEPYLRQSAEAGYDLAQRDLASLLARRGDMEGALAWLEAASRQGMDYATAALADRYTRDGSSERIKGYALLLLLKAKSAAPTQAMLDRITQMESTLAVDDIRRAADMLGAWVTGPTPVTLQARQGMAGVMALLRDSMNPR